MLYKLILVSIIHRKNKSEILLVRRNREPGCDKWSLPGGVGGLEIESDPLLAVLEEVKNDFGTNMREANLFRLKYTASPQPSLNLYFQSELEGEPKINDPKTIKEIKWVTLAEASQTELAFESIDKEVISQFREEFS